MDCLVSSPDRDLVTLSNKAEKRAPLRIQQIVSIPEKGFGSLNSASSQ